MIKHFIPKVGDKVLCIGSNENFQCCGFKYGKHHSAIENKIYIIREIDKTESGIYIKCENGVSNLALCRFRPIRKPLLIKDLL